VGETKWLTEGVQQWADDKDTCHVCGMCVETLKKVLTDLHAECCHPLDAALAQRIAEKVERACLDYDTDDMGKQQMIELYVKIIMALADEAGKEEK
jgi:hypothetical protein